MLTGKAEPAAEAARRQVAELQRRARGWFYLMYSPYWRRHIAIYMGECDHGIILQANSPDELWHLMNGVAPPGWQTEGLPHLSRRSVLPSPQRGRG
ncbi:hypothetical protein ACFMQL_12795 [Nonomuraea fastidiosa]|jgi:hypothetical protein|uniref:Uncharacterized protein n=1 Tax=[Actinomadura] parvosata subsp. kistnae TaxID=1909395 RepID=A0A1U9ZYY5_9ACTN|nr:hypothetical protein [Nonomuraea sp. ATCC 55076]AQZ63165.1 hypothetical protein BKM31_18370 [Nonomuraea sp. ATCC 55076]